jgi:hypothetical protein
MTSDFIFEIESPLGKLAFPKSILVESESSQMEKLGPADAKKVLSSLSEVLIKFFIKWLNDCATKRMG